MENAHNKVYLNLRACVWWKKHISNRAVHQLPCLCYAKEVELLFEDSREVLKILKQGNNMINVI